MTSRQVRAGAKYDVLFIVKKLIIGEVTPARERGEFEIDLEDEVALRRSESKLRNDIYPEMRSAFDSADGDAYSSSYFSTEEEALAVVQAAVDKLNGQP